MKIIHIQQEDEFGCAIACVAMVTGKTYNEVKLFIGEPETGLGYHVWHQYLLYHGYAVQHFQRWDCPTKKPLKVWPPKLWADIHICTVDAGRGNGTHCIVAFKDGTVFDPMMAVASRVEDYKGWSNLTAIFYVGDRPYVL